jgi:5-oxoprolinase (ATP-hydrolysing) subunit A
MSVSAMLDVNVDMGESFGRWQLGDDVGIMPFISSASIACGFHAGDPGTIRRTVHAAVEHGLQLGAHVALPDLLGFGRRRMAVAPSEG